MKFSTIAVPQHGHSRRAETTLQMIQITLISEFNFNIFFQGWELRKIHTSWLCFSYRSEKWVSNLEKEKKTVNWYTYVYKHITICFVYFKFHPVDTYEMYISVRNQPVFFLSY